MPIVIEPYREEHQEAVKAFNRRLRAATSDPDLVFYERASPAWLPRIEGSPLYNQYFVALEGDEVRGAYALKYERFFQPDEGEHTVACYHHPLSEGIVNRNYSAVGALLVRDALRREPLLYALGMGGLDRPLAKMLKVMGWGLHLVPFYFHVVHPHRFLRQMEALRLSRGKRWLMDLLAFSGIGYAAISALQHAKSLGTLRIGQFEATPVDQLPSWTESLWQNAKGEYRLASVRDHSTVSRLYDASEHLTKLCVTQRGKPIGWAIAGERRKNPKYGSLRVGSIVDCWAHPANAAPVILAASRALRRQGMDLIVSNQSHGAWCRALETCGFLSSQSNFVFAASKTFSSLLQGNLSDWHLTRANGDGLPRNF